MPSWPRIVTIAAAVTAIPLATALVAGTVASTSALDRFAAGTPARTAAAQALAPPTYQPAAESQFTPITPCRAIDTRPGRIAAGATHHFHIRGTIGFAEQGGKDGGCGVPASATGVAVSVSSVDIAGAGYLRIWPYGYADPGATVAHYQRGPITTTGATVTLGTQGSAYDVTAKAFQSGAGLVLDVTGYYAPPLAGFVSAAGGPYSGSPRMIAAAHTSTGVYEVQFDRTIRYCSAQVTTFGSRSYGTANTWFDSTRPDAVQVSVYNADGVAVDEYFYIHVLC